MATKRQNKKALKKIMKGHKIPRATLRQKVIVWLHHPGWRQRIYVYLADRHNRKLANEEYDKIADVEGYVDRLRNTVIVESPPEVRVFKVKP